MAHLIGNMSQMAFRKDAGLIDNNTAAYPNGSVVPNLALEGGYYTKIPFLSESMKNVQTPLDSKAYIGQAGYANSEIQSIRPSGSFKAEAYYEGAVPELICMAMGFENANTSVQSGSPNSLGGTAYRHLFELDNNLHREGWLAGEERIVSSSWSAGDLKVRSGVLGIDRVVAQERIRACMVNAMTVNFTPESVDFDFDMNGWQRTFGPYGAGGWTLPTVKYRALMTSMTVQLGTLTPGLGFDWEDGILPDIASGKINVNNNLKIDGQTTGSGYYIDEPIRNDFREVTIGMNFRSHKTIALLQLFDVDTLFKLSIQFTGAQIGSTGFAYTYKFTIPACKILDASAQIGVPGITAPDYMFKAFLPLTSPFSTSGKQNSIALIKGYSIGTTPQTYRGSELVCEVINTRSDNYLTYY